MKVAEDRLRLASLHLKQAAVAARATQPQYRATVSRAYYAMYHAARAATYLSYGGDDHEKHSDLPVKFPADFPDSEFWRNRLKLARLDRNRADYDPYPNGDLSFKHSAKEWLQDARVLVKKTRAYLGSKI
ncbi:hypothetical protein CEG14_14970 [Bordetella genomosp. 1]|uniref:HEPN domain-containing protein n=2 Tax=Bordetella genomosp. 1 TaxID=1395607 RepID=A0A261SGY7_9BORD|nr:hypothetical protein CEG14_14970 [Bordetella genomosp. 1]